MSAPVLAFIAKPGTGSAQNDGERELLGLFRSASDDAEKILRFARITVAERRPTRLTFEIELLASGKQRTFWNTARGGHYFVEPDVMLQLDSAKAVCEAADEYLQSFLEARAWPVDPTRSLEAVKIGDRHFRFSIRRGRYRLSVHFMPDWMERAWLRLVEEGAK
jgi:hypothetical protein